MSFPLRFENDVIALAVLVRPFPENLVAVDSVDLGFRRVLAPPLRVKPADIRGKRLIVRLVLDLIAKLVGLAVGLIFQGYSGAISKRHGKIGIVAVTPQAFCSRVNDDKSTAQVANKGFV